MKHLKLVVSSAFFSFVVVAAMVMVTILIIAFNTHAPDGYSTGLFDSVYFKVNEGVLLSATAGVKSPGILAIIFAVVFIVSTVSMYVFNSHKSKKLT